MRCQNCGEDVISVEREEDGDKRSFDLEKSFASETSCHGIAFWYKSTNSIQKAFWVVLVIGMTCGVVHQVASRIQNYYAYRTSSSVEQEFVSSIEFPSVTICNFNRLFWPDSEDEKLAMQVLNKISTPSDLAYARAINFPINTTHLNFYRNISNFSVSDYYFQKGFQVEDGRELLLCGFASELCTVANFTEILTSRGRCYTFNAANMPQLNQTVGGLGNGLTFMLNVRHWNYTEEPNYGRQEAGILFQVHPKDVTPDLDRHGVAVPVGRKGYALLSQINTDVMYKPWGKCDPPNQKALRYFSQYTLNSCLLDCFTDKVLQDCGCYHFDQLWASEFAPQCTIDQIYNCSSPLISKIKKEYSPDFCNCTIPCSFTEYPVRMSYSYLPIRETSLFYQTIANLPPDYINENIVGLEVTFETIGYTKQVQSKYVDESGLLSDVGGQLGLWIGMSFITIVEFVQYFIRRLTLWIKKPFSNTVKKMKGDESTKDAWEAKTKDSDT